MREQIARILMEARPNGGCIVRDWEAEGRDNPHVATALAQADAILPLMEKVAQAAIDKARDCVILDSGVGADDVRALSASEIVKEMCGG